MDSMVDVEVEKKLGIEVAEQTAHQIIHVIKSLVSSWFCSHNWDEQRICIGIFWVACGTFGLGRRSDWFARGSCISLYASILVGHRHFGVSIEMLLKLVKIYGPVVHSTLSAAPSVGVDLQAEQRLECCNSCFIDLQKIKQIIPSLTRRGGFVSKSAQELNLTLQEVL